MKRPVTALCILGMGLANASFAQDAEHLALDSPFASYVEEGFPFFGQTIDARSFGESAPSTNLTPRGIIVRLDSGLFACFDPDLLRWSLIWRANASGEYLTMDGMAPGSYRLPNRKAPSGQGRLPKPIGDPLFASPALPGWWSGAGTPPADDPRDPRGADPGEVGLGPIDAGRARFSGLRLSGTVVRVELTAGNAEVTELLVPGDTGAPHPKRLLRISPHRETLHVRSAPAGTGWISVPPADRERIVRVGTAGLAEASEAESRLFDPPPPPRRWKETIPSSVESASQSDASSLAFCFDDIGLPVPNPWQRNVRLSGLDFFPDGRIAVCTFDGDVWVGSGIGENSTSSLEWSRFASGLHEPMALLVVDETIQVFDRNGIVRLHDDDGNGEADFYENFSHVVPQTAETREFAMDMVSAPDGGFYLAKGGQIGATRGPANGTVVRISSDGRSYEIISTGLRQPYIGIDPTTGIVTSSDQQGNWKPATPIYRIEPGRYFGFQPARLKDKAVHPAPIDPPEVWIPHFVNASGASQVAIPTDARMRDLNGSLVHIGYNRPELFRVYLSADRTQGAVVPFLSGFPAGPLHGRVHPVDGRLYLAGFTIWGTSAERISGLFRIRPGEGESWLPESIRAGKRGVLLRFPRAVDPVLAGTLAHYTADRWNYRQTHEYGSGNFKLDGTPGQEGLPVTSTYLSEDGRSLFLGIPGMRPSHSLRVTYRIPHPDAVATVEHAYLTVHQLDTIDLESEGFGKIDVDLTVSGDMQNRELEIEATAALGEEVATRFGCLACHEAGDHAPAVSAGAEIVVGPPWNGLWKSRREFSDGSFLRAADETYLRESILDPGRRVAAGFETEKTGVGMPSYLGVLKEHEIESILLYIASLQKKK